VSRCPALKLDFSERAQISVLDVDVRFCVVQRVLVLVAGQMTMCFAHQDSTKESYIIYAQTGTST
jgi:hypothetical protein